MKRETALNTAVSSDDVVAFETFLKSVDPKDLIDGLSIDSVTLLKHFPLHYEGMYRGWLEDKCHLKLID